MKLRINNGLEAVYWNSFFRSLAVGVLGIFLPIYLFLLIKAATDSWIAGVRGMMVFILIERVLIVLTVIWAARLIVKIGFRLSVLLATVVEIILFLVWVMAENNLSLIYVAAVLGAPVIMFYWLSRLALFASDGQPRSLGQEVSLMVLLESGATVLGPFVGGVIVAVWGFRVLFGLGIVLLLFSTVPLFFMPHHRHTDGVGWRGLGRLLKSKERRAEVMAFGGQGVGDLMEWLWPVFIFLIIGSFEQLGLVVSAATMISMLAIWLAGRWFDWRRLKGDDRTMFHWGSVMSVAARFGRAWASSVWGVFVWNSVNGVVGPFYWLPLGSYQYQIAKREAPVAYFAYREIVYSTGRVLMAVAVIALIGLPWGWQLVFGLGAVAVLASWNLCKA